MSEDNVIKIVVAVIALISSILGAFIGYLSKSKKQAIEEARREQNQADQFDKLFSEMNGIKQRLDVHNKYAEKFGEIEVSLAGIKKDIEYIRKGKNG